MGHLCSAYVPTGGEHTCTGFRWWLDVNLGRNLDGDVLWYGAGTFSVTRRSKMPYPAEKSADVGGGSVRLEGTSIAEFPVGELTIAFLVQDSEIDNSLFKANFA